jgi:hypothetical protein
MSEKYIKYGRLLALISFVIGSFIFLLYYQTLNTLYLFIGYAYIVVFGVLNLGLLLKILNVSCKEENNKSKLRQTGFLMLLNIPVLLIYSYFAIVLLSTVRISLENNTNDAITQILIGGCEEIKVESLQAKEKKEIWVKIPTDCIISIFYTQNKFLKRDTILGYATPNMGSKIKYSF